MGEAEGGIGRFAWVVYVTRVYLMWLIKALPNGKIQQAQVEMFLYLKLTLGQIIAFAGSFHITCPRLPRRLDQ